MTAEQRVQLEKLVWVDLDRMSGTPCFWGTRVPVQLLLDQLRHGGTIDEFLEGCPTVTRDQVREIAAIKMADLNANDAEAAARMIEGTARSMGIEVVG